MVQSVAPPHRIHPGPNSVSNPSSPVVAFLFIQNINKYLTFKMGNLDCQKKNMASLFFFFLLLSNILLYWDIKTPALCCCCCYIVCCVLCYWSMLRQQQQQQHQQHSRKTNATSYVVYETPRILFAVAEASTDFPPILPILVWMLL